jgi:hypothetical protein
VADTNPKLRLYSGDSSSWTSSFSDYPATSWDAVATFQKYESNPVTILGVASGTDFTFTFTSEKSALMEPGEWNWSIRVKNGTTIKTISAGKTTILPNPERLHIPTHNEKCLGLIQDALESRFVDVQESISILGQNITKVPVGELHRLMNYYQARVNRERKFKERLTTGKRTRRSRIYLVD